MSEFLYSVEREYPVSLDVLWDAWVSAEKLEQWYCGTEFATVPQSVVSDAVVGGWWTIGIDVVQFDFVAYFYGTYTEVAPQSRLVHTMSYTQDADEFAARDLSAPHHTVTVDFEPRGDNAWVRFSQFGDLPEGEAPRAQAGMESYFDHLGKFLGLA